MEIYIPKDHWTLKTGYFEDPTPAIQVQSIGIKQLIGMACRAFVLFGSFIVLGSTKWLCVHHGVLHIKDVNHVFATGVLLGTRFTLSTLHYF